MFTPPLHVAPVGSFREEGMEQRRGGVGVEGRCPLCINRCWVAFIWRRVEQTDLRAEHGTHNARVCAHAHWKQTSGFSLEACARVRSTGEPLPVAAYDADADRCRCVWGCSVCVCARASVIVALVIKCTQDVASSRSSLIRRPAELWCLHVSLSAHKSPTFWHFGRAASRRCARADVRVVCYMIFCFLPSVQMKISQFLPISGRFPCPAWVFKLRNSMLKSHGENHKIIF